MTTVVLDLHFPYEETEVVTPGVAHKHPDSPPKLPPGGSFLNGVSNSALNWEAYIPSIMKWIIETSIMEAGYSHIGTR